MRNEMRRKCMYSRKQGEQLTTCETGRSFRARLRSRRAIARKRVRFGQPSRFGFGKAVLELFLPSATASLSNLDDEDCLDSAIRVIRCGPPASAGLRVQTRVVSSPESAQG